MAQEHPPTFTTETPRKEISTPERTATEMPKASTPEADSWFLNKARLSAPKILNTLPTRKKLSILAENGTLQYHNLSIHQNSPALIAYKSYYQTTLGIDIQFSNTTINGTTQNYALIFPPGLTQGHLANGLTDYGIGAKVAIEKTFTLEGGVELAIETNHIVLMFNQRNVNGSGVSSKDGSITPHESESSLKEDLKAQAEFGLSMLETLRKGRKIKTDGKYHTYGLCFGGLLAVCKFYSVHNHPDSAYATASRMPYDFSLMMHTMPDAARALQNARLVKDTRSTEENSTGGRSKMILIAFLNASLHSLAALYVPLGRYLPDAYKMNRAQYMSIIGCVILNTWCTLRPYLAISVVSLCMLNLQTFVSNPLMLLVALFAFAGLCKPPSFRFWMIGTLALQGIAILTGLNPLSVLGCTLLGTALCATFHFPGGLFKIAGFRLNIEKELHALQHSNQIAITTLHKPHRFSFTMLPGLSAIAKQLYHFIPSPFKVVSQDEFIAHQACPSVLNRFCKHKVRIAQIYYLPLEPKGTSLDSKTHETRFAEITSRRLSFFEKHKSIPTSHQTLLDAPGIPEVLNEFGIGAEGLDLFVHVPHLTEKTPEAQAKMLRTTFTMVSDIAKEKNLYFSHLLLLYQTYCQKRALYPWYVANKLDDFKSYIEMRHFLSPHSETEASNTEAAGYRYTPVNPHNAHQANSVHLFCESREGRPYAYNELDVHLHGPASIT